MKNVNNKINKKYQIKIQYEEIQNQRNEMEFRKI